MLDGLCEYAREPQRERQRGVEAAVLDRDDGLARNAEPLPEFLLCPAALLAKRTHGVLHGRRTATNAITHTNQSSTTKPSTGVVTGTPSAVTAYSASVAIGNAIAQATK